MFVALTLHMMFFKLAFKHGGENLVLRQSVFHFLPNIRDFAS